MLLKENYENITCKGLSPSTEYKLGLALNNSNYLNIGK